MWAAHGETGVECSTLSLTGLGGRGHRESCSVWSRTSDKNCDLQKRDTARRQRGNQGQECLNRTLLFASGSLPAASHWLNPSKSQKARTPLILFGEEPPQVQGMEEEGTERTRRSKQKITRIETWVTNESPGVKL